MAVLAVDVLLSGALNSSQNSCLGLIIHVGGVVVARVVVVRRLVPSLNQILFRLFNAQRTDWTVPIGLNVYVGHAMLAFHSCRRWLLV